MKSRGSVEMAALCQATTMVQWATTVKVDASTMSGWCSGKKTPRAAKRIELHAKGGPEPIAWDEPIVTAPPRAVSDGTATPSSPEATRKLADRLQGLAEAMLDDCEAASDPSERIRQVEKLSSVVANLGKLTGASIVNERQILMAPAFRMLMTQVRDALDPWPEAMRAVGEALAAASSKAGIE